MIFAPHILQKRIDAEPSYDEYGRIVSDSETEWKTIGNCRCDDNTTQEFKTDNGEVFRPDFHVVCQISGTIQPGDFIRCLDGSECRGQGRVTMTKRTNFFDYTELWM